jgi:citrate lyase subunit beta/citryl-CoA lyase
MAAAEAGVFAYDGAFADIKDAEGFRAEAGLARKLGFLGKSCIHPSQVALANQVFRPGEAEIEQAQRLLAAARLATANGAGAFLLDGRMVDTPDIRRAEQILASGQLD